MMSPAAMMLILLARSKQPQPAPVSPTWPYKQSESRHEETSQSTREEADAGQDADEEGLLIKEV